MINKIRIPKKNIFYLTKRNLFIYIFFILLTLIYFYVGFSSYGYDDEFNNINIIEKSNLIDTIKFVNSVDKHPPLSYIFNWFLYHVFYNWNYVRGFISVTLIISIFNFYKYLKTSEKSINAILFFSFITTNPAILMWGTSIRWYSLYLIILFWILKKPPLASKWFIWKLPLGLLLLAYTNYITFIFALPLIIYYFYDAIHEIKKRKFSYLSIYLFTFFLYLYQFNILINIHLGNSTSQFQSYRNSSISYIASSLANQGTFPISIFGFLSIFSTLFILLFLIIDIYQTKKDIKYFAIYSLLLFTLFFSGLMGKYRNLVLLEPFKYLFFSSKKFKNNLIFLPICLIFLSNIHGSINVIMHKNTLKNDWNISVDKVLSKTNEIYNSCGEDVQIFHYSPLFGYHLKNQGYESTNLASDQKLNYNLINKNSTCVLFIKTFKGTLNKSKYNLILDIFDRSNLNLLEKYQFSRDNFFQFKQKFDPDFPEYAVTLNLFSHKD